MNLTERQSDAVTELINIAFGRTTAALSELTGHRVLVESPVVSVVPLETLGAALGRYAPGDVASIHQDFSGPIAGDALLILSQPGAAALTGLLTDTPMAGVHLDDSAREVLTEVGNILLNACLSMFGNMLDVRVTFSVPRMRLDTVQELVSALLKTDTDARHAIVIAMEFRVRETAVTGYLAMVLGVASLQSFVREVERWEARAHASS